MPRAGFFVRQLEMFGRLPECSTYCGQYLCNPTTFVAYQSQCILGDKLVEILRLTQQLQLSQLIYFCKCGNFEADDLPDDPVDSPVLFRAIAFDVGRNGTYRFQAL
jgi:hypothetical protein